MRPGFSIVMPVFNHAPYLEEAVSSVLAQTFENWELIAINDGSTDDSPRILDMLSQRDRRIRAFHQQNKGAAATRNRAFGMAGAPWICYLDSDDIWYPETLAHYHRYLTEHSDSRFCYGYRHRLQDGKIIQLAARYQSSVTGSRELFQEMFLSTLCVCHRQELIREVGGYDEKLPLGEDYDLFLRMSSNTQFEPLGIATGMRRRHTSNLSRQTGFSRLVEAGILLRFLASEEGQKISTDTVSKRLGRVFYASGREYFKMRCFRQSRTAMAQARLYTLPFKGRLLGLLAGFLQLMGTEDRRPNPLPLPPYSTPQDLES